MPVLLYQLGEKLLSVCCYFQVTIILTGPASLEPDQQHPEREDEYGQDHRLAGQSPHLIRPG